VVRSVLANLERTPGSATDVAMRMNFDTTPVNVAVKLLLENGNLEPFGGAYQVKDARKPIDYSSMFKRRKLEEIALEKVVGYAQTHACRRAFLVGHFGERLAPCGRCDACDPKLGELKLRHNPLLEHKPSSSPTAKDRIKSAIAKLLEEQALPAPTITALLHGSKSEAVERFGLQKHPMHGALSQHGRQEIREALLEMVQRGAAINKNDTIQLVGRDLSRDFNHDLTTEARAKPERKKKTEPDGPLLQDLWAWRRDAAREANVSAFIVASNATLEAIAEAMPNDLRELGAIKGVGPVLIEKYGAAVLELLGQHDAPIAPESPLERLTTWRQARAKRDGGTPGAILNEGSLAALAELNPRDATDLLLAPGIGLVKFERYGQDILTALGAAFQPLESSLIERMLALKSFRHTYSKSIESEEDDWLEPHQVLSNADVHRVALQNPQTLEGVQALLPPQHRAAMGPGLLEALQKNAAKTESVSTSSASAGTPATSPRTAPPFSTPAELLELAAQNETFDPALLEKHLPTLPEAHLPRALEVLAKLGAKFEVVRPYLDDSREGVAAAAVSALATLDSSFDMGFLLEDPRPRVRLAAVRVCNDPSRLERVLQGDGVSFVRTAAQIRLWRLSA
jgi:ribonuclease D